MIVYKYTNKENNKVYIGITSRTLEERERSHVYEAYDEKNSKVYNAPFKRAIRKYSIGGFIKEVLHENVTKEEAIELEKKYIKEYKSYYKYQNSNGYNATIGGEYISCPKDQVYQIDINTYQIIKIWNSAYDAETHGFDNVYECCNKTGNLGCGYIWYYEFDYLKLSKDELIHDINYRLNKLLQLDIKTNNIIKIWNSAQEVSRELKISQGNISMVCNGIRKSASGYAWKYYKEYYKSM